MSGVSSSSLRERKKQRTRDDIYDAALALFAARPYDGVTVEEICAQAGVAPATFFRVYGTKGGLLIELNRRIAAKASERLATLRTSIERLEAVRAVIVESWVGTPPGLHVLVREFLRTADYAAATKTANPELLALVTEIVQEGQAAGELTDELDPKLSAWIIINAVASVTVAWFRNPAPTELERRTRAALDAVLYGLARNTTGH